MRGIIFDMDGVLVDSMPSHFEAWKAAFKEIADIEVAERELYLLEGMRGIELVHRIFKQKNISNSSLAEKVSSRKNEIFRLIRKSRPFEGVRELISESKCRKAVVSGSAREDVETILSDAFDLKTFDVLITSDDIQKGKPDPSAFLTALKKLNLKPSEAMIVENAPLGVEAANKAGILCYVTLNTSPLCSRDFAGLIERTRILSEIKYLREISDNWCKF